MTGYASSVDTLTASQALIRDYPRIYFACHRRHVRDPRTLDTLSAHAASVLDHLDPVEPTFVSALAGHMGVTASTMSLALDRLQAGGYVRRERDARDARRVGVVLTESGERIRRASSVLDPELVMALVQRLGDAERGPAIEGLALLAAAAMRMADVGRSGVQEEAQATDQGMAHGGPPVESPPADGTVGAGGAGQNKGDRP